MKHLFLQSAGGGGGLLTLIFFVIFLGILFYARKINVSNGQDVHKDNKTNMIKRINIPAFFVQHKWLLLIALIIIICLIYIPLEKSRVEKLEHDAFEEGYEKGKKDGYRIGYDEGYSQGESDGLNRGQRSGYSRGYNDAQIRTSTCITCNGRGVKACFHCNGSGCGLCNNTGVEKCSICNGRGWNQY